MSNIDDELDTIIDAYLNYLEGNGPEPRLDTIPADLRNEAQARLRIVDAMWATHTEDRTLTNDPVAQRFGFDKSGETIFVNGRRVAALRKSAPMDLKELRAKITAAGGDITAMALLNLEQNTSTPVPQPTASALVAALDTTLPEIAARPASDADPVQAFLASPAFDELIASWAADHDRDPATVRPIVTNQLQVAQFRAIDVTDEQLLDITRAILHKLEQ